MVNLLKFAHRFLRRLGLRSIGNNPDSISQYAFELIKCGKYKEAEGVLQDAVACFPGHAGLRINHAECAMRTNRWNQALDRWEVVRQVAPECIEGYGSAGHAALELGRLDQAETLLAEAIRRGVNYPWPFLHFGLLSLRCGDIDASIERLSEAYQRFPNEPSVVENLAMVLKKANRLDEAEEILDTSVARIPQHRGIRQSLVEVCMHKQNLAKAETHWLTLHQHGIRDRRLFEIGAQLCISLILDSSLEKFSDELWDAVLGEPEGNDGQHLPALVHEARKVKNNQYSEYNRLKSFVHSKLAGTQLQTDTSTTTLVMVCFETKSEDDAYSRVLWHVLVNSSTARLMEILDHTNKTNIDIATFMLRRFLASESHISDDVALLLSLFATTFDYSLTYDLFERYSNSVNGRRDAADIMATAYGKRKAFLEAALHYSSPPRAGQKQLKVALCVSGQLRGYQAALATWSRLGLFDHNVTTFVHTWETIGRKFPIPSHAARSFSGKFLHAYQSVFRNASVEEVRMAYPAFFDFFAGGSKITESDLRSAYKTDFVVVEDDLSAPYSGMSNSEKMYLKVQKCFSMAVEECGEFDVVIRIRPDKPVVSAEPIDWLHLLCEFNAKCKIMTDMSPYFHSGVGYIIGDQFAAGNHKAMSIYSSAYEFTKYTQNESSIIYPRAFKPHENFALSCFFAGIMVDSISGLKFGEPLDCERPSLAQIQSLLKLDVGASPRSINDRILLQALECDLGGSI